MLQPVLVSQQADGSFQLITGERRWRAVQLAGIATLPAMVKEATPQASLELALVENIQRRDLNPLEEAHAFRQLLDEHGLTQEQLGQRVGKSRVTITNTLRLLHLPDAGARGACRWLDHRGARAGDADGQWGDGALARARARARGALERAGYGGAGALAERWSCARAGSRGGWIRTSSGSRMGFGGRWGRGCAW